MSPDAPEGRYDYLVKALRKIAEGKTPEEIEAWKAEIDRGRHPQLYCQTCGSWLEADTSAEPPSACTAEENKPTSESRN